MKPNLTENFPFLHLEQFNIYNKQSFIILHKSPNSELTYISIFEDFEETQVRRITVMLKSRNILQYLNNTKTDPSKEIH